MANLEDGRSSFRLGEDVLKPHNIKLNHEMRKAISFRDLWVEAAVKCLTQDVEASWRYRKELTNLVEEMLTHRGGLDFPKTILGEPGELVGCLASALARERGVSPQEAERTLRVQFADNRSQGTWSTLESPINCSIGGRPMTIRDYQVPLNGAFARLVGGAERFEVIKQAGRAGAVSKYGELAAQYRSRVPNGWLTALYAEDGEQLFQAFRSAALTYYGIDDPAARREATLEAAELLFEAIVLKALHEKPSSERLRVLTGEDVLRGGIVALDLQTWVAKKSQPQEFDIERTIIDEQRVALQAQAQRRVMRIHGIEGEPIVIRVEYDYFPFNFPVHEKCFTERVGWEQEVHARNQTSMARLLGGICSGLVSKQSGIDERRSGRIGQALANVRESYEKLGSVAARQSPYTINAQLANLAFLAGHTVHFNCRSGKDRSGFLDAEAKLHALELAEGRSAGVDDNLPFKLIYGGGSPKIQELNTGALGSRLSPFSPDLRTDDPLLGRVGIENWEVFKGLSDYADT